MNCKKTLKDYNILKIMGRDAIYIPVAYKKIKFWLGFRLRVFLDIPTAQNEINKCQNIGTKKIIFRTETSISNIH